MECLSIASCIYQGLKLSLDKIVDIECKFRKKDMSVCIDIKDLERNIKRYRKKDRKLIKEFFSKYLDISIEIATANNTASRTANSAEPSIIEYMKEEKNNEIMHIKNQD